MVSKPNDGLAEIQIPLAFIEIVIVNTYLILTENYKDESLGQYLLVKLKELIK